MCGFDVMILLYYPLGRFGSETCHSGNIVRGVTHKSLQIYEFRRGHSPGFLHIIGIIDFRGSHALGGFRQIDFDMLIT